MRHSGCGTGSDHHPRRARHRRPAGDGAPRRARRRVATDDRRRRSPSSRSCAVGRCSTARAATRSSGSASHRIAPARPGCCESPRPVAAPSRPRRTGAHSRRHRCGRTCARRTWAEGPADVAAAGRRGAAPRCPRRGGAPAPLSFATSVRLVPRRRTQVLGRPQPEDPRRRRRRATFTSPLAAPRRRPRPRPRGRRARPWRPHRRAARVSCPTCCPTRAGADEQGDVHRLLHGPSHAQFAAAVGRRGRRPRARRRRRARAASGWPTRRVAPTAALLQAGVAGDGRTPPWAHNRDRSTRCGRRIRLT